MSAIYHSTKPRVVAPSKVIQSAKNKSAVVDGFYDSNVTSLIYHDSTPIELKGLVAGNNVNIQDEDGVLIVSASSLDTHPVEISSLGSGEKLFSNGNGPYLTRSIVGGENTKVTSTNDEIIISNTATTISSSGNGKSLVSNGTGPELSLVGLTSGNGIDLTSDDDTIIITSTVVGGDEVTLVGSNVGESLVSDGVGPDLVTKDVVAGDGINLTSDNNSVTITSTKVGGDEVTLTNAGKGDSLVVNGAGPNLSLVSLSSGKDISITSNKNNLSIAYVGDDFSNTLVHATCNDNVLWTSNSTLTDWSVVIDSDSNFNSETGTYTVPSTGVYELSAVIRYTTDYSSGELTGSSSDVGYYAFVDKETTTYYDRAYIPTIKVDSDQVVKPLSSANIPLRAMVSLSQGDEIVLRYEQPLPDIMPSINTNLGYTSLTIRRIY